VAARAMWMNDVDNGERAQVLGRIGRVDGEGNVSVARAVVEQAGDAVSKSESVSVGDVA
jgi:hypothetical protein